MENDLIGKAQTIADEMTIKAQEKGSGAKFSVQIITTGTKSGEVQIEKEKPSGEVVIYPISKD